MIEACLLRQGTEFCSYSRRRFFSPSSRGFAPGWPLPNGPEKDQTKIRQIKKNSSTSKIFGINFSVSNIFHIDELNLFTTYLSVKLPITIRYMKLNRMRIK